MHSKDRISPTRELQLKIASDILSTNADNVRREIFEVIDPQLTPDLHWDTLSLDLSSTRMIDSVGLNLMVSVIKTLQSRQKKIKVLISSSHVERTLRFTRLDQMMEVVGA